MRKIFLYLHTVRYLTIYQIYYRILKKTKLLHIVPWAYKSLIKYNLIKPKTLKDVVVDGFVIKELDLNEQYIKRYQVENILNNEFIFLNQRFKIDLSKAWKIQEQSRLWGFNLHYFEYIYGLYYYYNKTKNQCYYLKYKELVTSWIDLNPPFFYDAWHPHTISVRICNWINSIELFFGQLEKEEEFLEKMIHSIYLQYKYLSHNIEKDISANHYLENLKALIIASAFFKQDKNTKKYVGLLLIALQQQILQDGMHYELSIMYHDLVLENLIKIQYIIKDSAVLQYINNMNYCTRRLRNHMGKTPFFNDSANNISKDYNILNGVINQYLIKYHANNKINNKNHCTNNINYCILEQKGNKCIKLIIKSSNIVSKEQPGHTHCDALSFEMSLNQTPFIVNSGTYQYEEGFFRDVFRKTSAHNTVIINDVEQYEYWGSFRIARRLKFVKGFVRNFNKFEGFYGICETYKGQVHKRYILKICKNLFVILDHIFSRRVCNENDFIYAKSYLHFHPYFQLCTANNGDDFNSMSFEVCDVNKHKISQIQAFGFNKYNIFYGTDKNGWYSPEYGIKEPRYSVEFYVEGINKFCGYAISLQEQNNPFEVYYNEVNKQIRIEYNSEKYSIDIHEDLEIGQ